MLEPRFELIRRFEGVSFFIVLWIELGVGLETLELNDACRLQFSPAMFLVCLGNAIDTLESASLSAILLT